MTKPYIICHMMTSVDGRIDCDMTAQLQGTQEYYSTLKAIEAPTTLSGRVTAQLELAQTGEFESKTNESLNKESFNKNNDAAGYEVIVDTKGVLLWDEDYNYSKPHIIITSEQVKKDYLDYLDSKQISWIATGKNQIDLARAVEILAEQFNVERMGIVGGGHIDGSFLDTGLTDEISLLIGPGVDGRQGMPAVFDGRLQDRKPMPLKLQSAQTYEDGAVWLRYLVK
ncbi:dihydrofolate reductase family protein [Companilactobacillus kimchii]|uniref:2,5-diamino-6-(Ribosylamino)-4(3H)-pyrimidinone 5'-phosphate reductase n=3 Tax=Companilactobacillus kimchii TaxID=2801452 RepID=A0A210P6M5_9LACO|nr:dihydrofolate reductase family protein [Companilactobacillus kimchii]KAE9559666.1 deaminase [Companilactobacillus kimchii]OWF32139.1 2,5-diamino-6-(ribosylamino)-4(3H)-pyrimidinone 5'-phosphate reductase [Companilactobacillus kimchii]GEO47914.1 5-amino-6-(5-phosphoribosylamino)uracil reductase [Companilactobacillus paralimentarius]